ncbi:MULTISPECIES: hypothetical protein [Alphaproteobacteria]|uniref:Uncharacterized protein n=2 Tax=Alphaproteobacteria TaxID=28211 RepID=A0A512HFU1_9HYPH|nr:MULTISPECIES: hypothetical protein [Alphaproteobacteria]GEO84318.1 hypothetical protein RNA01_12500 [Ciceribacter naphthalenivorans]GLR24854.1 hypothetical protein GCM10007920_46480 [Ciceribacter naphthalenivorans]GLT07710.1 hypothetical protein GCM10007926_46480 [Sphingomonas psychrolutea]
MSNVVEFKKPPKPKEPKKPNPRLKTALIALGVVTAFIIAWAYFQFLG